MLRQQIYTSLLTALFLTTACTADEVCPDTWMTFFVDDQNLMVGNLSGVICAEDSLCRSIPGLWGPCPDEYTNRLCGAPNAWLCLGTGNFTYEIYDGDNDNATVHEGAFTMPPAEGSACRARVYLGNEIKVETLTCASTAQSDIISDGIIPTADSTQSDGINPEP